MSNRHPASFCLQSLVAGGDSDVPTTSDPVLLGAQLDGARFLDVESVIVEERLFTYSQYSLAFAIAGNIVRGTLRHGCPCARSQPQNVRRRGSRGGGKRNEQLQRNGTV
jgi:hypothetical protein